MSRGNFTTFLTDYQVRTKPTIPQPTPFGKVSAENPPVGPNGGPPLDKQHFNVGPQSDGRKKSKVRTDFVSPAALWDIQCLMTHIQDTGKYKPHDWLQACTANDVIQAAKRHIQKWELGEDTDPETGFLQLTHAATSLLMGLHMMLLTEDKRKMYDDRGKLGKSADFNLRRINE